MVRDIGVLQGLLLNLGFTSHTRIARAVPVGTPLFEVENQGNLQSGNQIAQDLKKNAVTPYFQRSS
jgi:hypothetical protein